MKITRLESSNVETYAVKDDEDRLCGLITKHDDNRFKIDLMQKFVHFEPTKEQACAWVRGAYTAVESLLDKRASDALAARRSRSPQIRKIG
jgi:hypothetical protein